jgi:predicted CXXCH cytochrome family protein
MPVAVRPMRERRGPATRGGVKRALGVSAALMLATSGLGTAVPAVPESQPHEPVDMQGKGCTAAGCHADLQQKKMLHGPVAQGTCKACHAQAAPQVHTFDYTHPREKLCEACHVVNLKNFVHKPLRDGQCTGCHDPHQSDHRFILKADPAQTLCLSCHDKEPFLQSKHIHGPVAAGACILCHESHSSWNPKLVIHQGRELCLFCHEDVDRRLAAARHVHPPAQKECGACHDPHGSEHAMQIRQKKRTLCVSCHEDIGRLLETSQRVHAAVEIDDGCGNCHNAHGTTLPRLLKRSLMDTCLSCHNKEITMPDGKKLADMATLLKDNPNHHGPVRRADCNACHDPHASPNFRLLSKVYPEYFYAPFDLGNYDLCFQCHMRDTVLVKEGRGLTRFKDGELNLHFVHVNKEEKGRSCRACHEVHASKRPAHVREQVPFGPSGWQIEINFKQTETGGSCAPACHRPKEYVRTADETSLPPPRETFPSPATKPAASQTHDNARGSHP